MPSGIEEDQNPYEGRFLIGDTLVETDKGIINNEGISRHLEPRLLKLLTLLAQNSGTTVSRKTIQEEVWAGIEVSDESLTQAISNLRQSLGDSARQAKVILTVPKKGYRLDVPVKWLNENAATESAPNPVVNRSLGALILICIVLSISLVVALLWRSNEEIEIEIIETQSIQD